MRTKQIAGFFLYLFCFDYVSGVAAAVEGHRIAKRQTSCRLTQAAELQIKQCVERIRDGVPDSMDVDHQRVEEYDLINGRAIGFKDFHCTWRCSCGRNLVRLFITVNFVRILLTFVLSVADDLLRGLLGGVGSSLSRLLGNVVNLLIRILALDIRVEITVVQRFSKDTNCILESYRVSKVDNIIILGIQLQAIAHALSPLLAPVVDLVLQIILNGSVREIFAREFQRIRLEKTSIICS